MVKFITSISEYNQILNDTKDKLIVMNFTATWCQPCKKISVKYLELASEFENVDFYKIDIDQNQSITDIADVSSVPTFQFYKNNNKVDELVGANEIELRNKIIKN